ncbi:myomegalin-like [Callospermophilus lateralis]|uniref:myomegalin-like n=1 Tax=Callospermophilus lateralis TaxID=76772 RepID=UPI0040388B8F
MQIPWPSSFRADSDDLPGMKNSLKLEGDTTDGSFTNKHGLHIIGHIDEFTTLRERIEEGKQLVQKIQSLLRPTCNFLGLESQSSEVKFLRDLLCAPTLRPLPSRSYTRSKVTTGP